MSLKLLNCWEYKNCGREKNGLMVDKLGECPVSTSYKHDGLNNGQGAGRICWRIPKTACHTHGRKIVNNCYECEFYRRVAFEEEQDLPVLPIGEAI